MNRTHAPTRPTSSRSRLSRRSWLKVGTGALLGLSLPELVRSADPRRARAKSLIVFFLEGGPSHIDLWDMKPEAPENVRGDFRPIETTLPGLQVCEHLPRTAQVAHHLTLLRSIHHTIVDHNAGAYFALTGKPPLSGGELIVRPRPDNFPALGSVVSKLRPIDDPLPPFVHVPDWMSNLGHFLPGQNAGFLGGAHDPFVSADPSLPDYEVPGLSLPEDLTIERLERRRGLLEAVNAATDRKWATVAHMNDHYKKAYELISSPEARRAFDLSEEPEWLRERYGRDPDNPRTKQARQFGGLPHLGQCALLARRLIESGVRVVTLCTGARYDQTWDTHRDHFPLLKRSILPMFDRAFSALIEDLHVRGLLDETLVVAMGEFGRTPKVGQITSDAGADANGRDHWPHCYSALFAGGGVPAGSILGASDRFGAEPAELPVTPQDVAATIYELMGIPHDTLLRDPKADRPHNLTDGEPIRPLLG